MLRFCNIFHGASQVVPVVKNSPANAEDIRDMSSIPGLGRSPGGGHGNPLQYSCLENPIDRGTWRATVHGFARVGHNLVTKPPPVRTHSKPSGTKVRPFSPGKFINVHPLCLLLLPLFFLHAYLSQGSQKQPFEWEGEMGI